MKKTSTLIISMLIFNLLVFALTVGDFLALHDIQKDYVSAEILQILDVTTSAPLPAWTATQGEWQMVTVSFVARFLFLPANALLLWNIFKSKEKSA